MRNGDISNEMATIVVMIDGAGVLYTFINTRWCRFLLWLACKFRSSSLALSCVNVERLGMSIIKNIDDRPDCFVKVLAFDSQERFILGCILKAVYKENWLREIYSENEFRDLLAMSDIVVSNHFPGVQSYSRRHFFNSVEQLRSLISQEIGFKGKQ